jgi:hypothetical protein
MAFNPFTSFRKHQKVWMAGILLVCMITFVLCTGVSGDFSSWLMSVFGKNRGAVIAKMYGKKITDTELRNVRLKRRVANEFMIAASNVGANKAFQDEVGKLDPDTRKQIGRDPRLISFMVKNPGLFAGKLSPEQMANRRKVFQRLGAILDFQMKLFQAQRTRRYFEGSDSDEDLFAFLLWRGEADRLDIQLTDNGVRAEVNRSALTSLDDPTWQDIEKFLRRRDQGGKGLAFATSDYVMDALRDEFRVRLAQTWHLGYRPGALTKPAATVTPEERYAFFKDKRSEFEVQVLPLSVEAFVDRVKFPGNDKLRPFFEKYKNKEKNPASPEPGFKLPRRVALSWLTGDPNSKYYQGLSKFILAATKATFPLGWEARLLDEYDKVKEEFRLPKWSEPESHIPLYLSKHERAKQQARRAAALLGQVVGGGRIGVPLALTVPWAYQAPAVVRAAKDRAVRKAVAEEHHKRVAFAATVVLSGINPLPPCLPPGIKPTYLPFTGLWQYASDETRYVPLALVKDRLLVKMRDKLAQDQVSAAVKEVQKSVTDFHPAEKPLEIRRNKIRKLVADARKKYGLQVESNEGTRDHPGTRDIHDIGEDPKIQALKRDANGQERDLTKLVLDPSDTFVPKLLDSFFPMNQFEGPLVLVWKTEVIPSRVPDAYGNVIREVEKQWKMKRARKIAQREARKIARALAKLSANDDDGRRRLLKDWEARLRKANILKSGENLIDLFNVAPLKKNPSVQPGQKATYSKFQLSSTEFKYPAKNWADKILALGKPGNKKVAVLENQPETYIYVAVRVSRPTARKFDFLTTLRVPDQLWTLCQEHYAKLYRAKVLDQLKKRAEFEDLRSEETKEKERKRQKEEEGGGGETPFGGFPEEE